MAVERWLPALTKLLQSAVPGTQAAYTADSLPASLQALPAWIVLPRRGALELGGANIGLIDVLATLYCSPANLPEAYAFCFKSIDLVAKAVAGNLTLGGLVAYCKPPDLPAPFFEGAGAVNSIYGDKAFIGIIYNLVVKEYNNYSPTA